MGKADGKQESYGTHVGMNVRYVGPFLVAFYDMQELPLPVTVVGNRYNKQVLHWFCCNPGEPQEVPCNKLSL